jgi:hypothetical protein
MNLQCTWATSVSIDGLNKRDQERIKKIGFRAWLNEDHTPIPPKRKRKKKSTKRII